MKQETVFLTALLLLFLSVSSFAGSTNVDGYYIQNFRPASDGKKALALTESDTLGNLNARFGFYFHGSRGILSAGNPVNNDTVDILDTMLVGDFLFGIGVTKYLDFGLDVPLYFYERGRDFNNASIFTTSDIGDVRFDAKLNIVRDIYYLPNIAILLQLYAPTGTRDKFTGNKGATYEGKLILDRNLGDFYVALNAGFRMMPNHDFANISIGKKLTFGIGAAYILPVWNKSVDLTAEFLGSSATKKFTEVTSPLEFLGGVRKRFENKFDLILAGGAGLTRGIGAPDYRALLGVGYALDRASKKIADEGPPPTAPIEEVVYFAFDSHRVGKDSFQILDGVAELANEKNDSKIVVEGYSDGTGSSEYNLTLSHKRALEVVKYLKNRQQIDADRIVVKYFGENNPVALNSTREGRSKNRRVKISIF